VAHSKLDQPKRGFLVNVATIPPLIYPFQYNPTEVTDTMRLTWGAKYAPDDVPARGLTGVVSGLQADVAAFQGPTGGVKSGIGQILSTSTEVLGRLFSAAEVKRFEKEEARTLTFRFAVDGREQRPGEPARRRNPAGDVVGDLAVIRSFAYPQAANWLDVAGTAKSADRDWVNAFVGVWFNEPPTMTLVLGDMSMEGYVTELKISETLFNAELNPTRAEVEIELIEKINSISFVLDALKRIGRSAYYTDYEDIGKALF